MKENSMTWEDFACWYTAWDREELAARIAELECFGPSDEVCEAVCRMPTFELQEQLYHRALDHGVRFCRGELAEMRHPVPVKGFWAQLFAKLADRLQYYRGGDDWEEWEVVWD